MKIYCFIFSFLALSTVRGNPLVEPVALSPGNIQYHSQDTSGQYKYGYSNPQSSKEESRSSDGITRGSYSYVDANGKLQSVTYQADVENGFQLTSSSLTAPRPADGSYANKVGNKDRQANVIEITPADEDTTLDGKIDRDESFPSHKLNQNNPLIHPAESNSEQEEPPRQFPLRNQFTKILPLFYPVGVGGSLFLPAYPEPGTPGNNGFTSNWRPLDYSNQYHLHDGHGHYAYGYRSGSSAKEESRGIDGVTRGAYSYFDANGALQAVSYTADAENGFRVAATNWPVA